MPSAAVRTSGTAAVGADRSRTTEPYIAAAGTATTSMPATARTRTPRWRGRGARIRVSAKAMTGSSTRRREKCASTRAIASTRSFAHTGVGSPAVSPMTKGTTTSSGQCQRYSEYETSPSHCTTRVR